MAFSLSTFTFYFPLARVGLSLTIYFETPLSNFHFFFTFKCLLFHFHFPLSLFTFHLPEWDYHLELTLKLHFLIFYWTVFNIEIPLFNVLFPILLSIGNCEKCKVKTKVKGESEALLSIFYFHFKLCNIFYLSHEIVLWEPVPVIHLKVKFNVEHRMDISVNVSQW